MFINQYRKNVFLLNNGRFNFAIINRRKFSIIPESVSMVVVTKKNINSKNAISAMEPAFTSGAALFAIIYLLVIFLTPDIAIAPIAMIAKA